MEESKFLDWFWRIELVLYCAFWALLFIGSNPAQSPIFGIPLPQLITGLGLIVFILPVLLAYFDYRIIKQKMTIGVNKSQAKFFLVEYLATGILIVVAAPFIVKGIDPFGIFAMLSFLTLFPYLVIRSVVSFEKIAGREISLGSSFYPQYQRTGRVAGFAEKAAEEATKLATPPILAPVQDALMAEASPEPQKSVEKFTLKKALYLIIPSLLCTGFVIEMGFYSPFMFGLEYKVLYALLVWITICAVYAMVSGIISVVPASFIDGMGRQVRKNRQLVFAAPLLTFVAGVALGAIFFSGIVNSNYHNYQLAKHPELKYCERYDPTAPPNNPPCYADYAEKFGDRDICYLAESSMSECLKIVEKSSAPS